jgi:hypothetical protein
MSDENEVTKLGQHRYITLAVRMLVGPQDELQGTLIDQNETAIGQFRQLDQLPDLIRRWLDDHQPSPGD